MAPTASAPSDKTTSAAVDRDARKAMARLERQIEKLAGREAALHAELATNATDFERVSAPDGDFRVVSAERESLEEPWLEMVT